MILITGTSGFIGKNLIEFVIKSESVSIHDLVLLSSVKHDQIQTILHQNYSFTKEDFVKFGIHTIHTVIHLGAFTPKNKSTANSIPDNLKNIDNTVHLINNLPSKPSKIIYISTLDVYQLTDEIIDENTRVNPATFYGKCKLFCEDYLREWCAQNESTLHILRLGHIYGAGEEEYEKFIPLTIKKLKSNELPVLYTTGEEKRSYIHIDDCVRLIWKSLDVVNSEVINIASSRNYSILSIFKMLLEMSNLTFEKFEIGDVKGSDSLFNCTKMEQLLGKEEIDFFDGLKSEYLN